MRRGIWQVISMSSGNFPNQLEEAKPRIILVGGFLGAGKTTLIGALVGRLRAAGRACGVVTNDQAAGLVDTALANAAGGTVAEVAGGCFCCKLEELVDRLRTVSGALGDEGGAPVIVAEPVGSCTDLVATVLLPLERTYAVEYALSPLSVVLDGRRALASLGGRKLPGMFSKDVGYIYRKQIEEAEILVVNKIDLLAEADLEDLLARLEREYPGKEVFTISAQGGQGVDGWVERVMAGRAAPQRLMEVDYVRYAIGEAELGWLNAEGAVRGDGGSGDKWLLELAKGIAGKLGDEGYEVAHFKMALKDPAGRLGTVNQVISGMAPEISRSFGGALEFGELTVNLRAQGEPGRLREIVLRALEPWAEGEFDIAAFRPGEPQPTARVLVI